MCPAAPDTTVLPNSNQLNQWVGSTFIVAHRETTDRLEHELVRQGFRYKVLRHGEQPAHHAAIYSGMLNHCRAWEMAALEKQPVLVVEADFVPVVGLGHLPLPFDPHQADVGIAWLYTCAPQIYCVTAEGYAEGFSTALVAYVVTPAAARHLCELASFITETYGTGYYPFDSKIDGFLRQRGFKNYIGFRNYGEHGGIPNPEHRRYGMSGVHRADVLYGRLAFLPVYAGHGWGCGLRFIGVRCRARLKGIARLLVGKFVRLKVLRNCSAPGRMLKFVVSRQLTL